MTDSRHIVIVGGGFAGVTLAQRLERKLPGQHRLTLISEENHIVYSPLLAEVVGASILPGHVVAPLRQMVRRTRICMARVSDIDTASRRLCYSSERSGVMDFDHLVLACGSSANLEMVPGMARHGLPLKTVGDALFLRNRIMDRLEQAAMEDDPERQRWLTTFIIIGGGFSGVEVAGELADFLRTGLRYYPEIDPGLCCVIVLHDGDHILPELPRDLGEFAYRKMSREGLDIHLGSRVRRVHAEGVELESGEHIDGGTMISTIGTAPNPLVEQLPLPRQHGWIETRPDMSVPGHEGVWALGDCAVVMNARDGKRSPPTAQFATRQAGVLADNIAARLDGRPTRSFSYKPMGQLASIGHNKAVAQLFGLHISGFIGWLLWRAVYLMKVPTLSRKVRVFLEWNWEMLFPPDVAHLGFVRSGQDPQRADETPPERQRKSGAG